MQTANLVTIEKMLTAVLRSTNHIHWIGGYVYGRTSNDDPFIILYPAAEHLKEKAVRVYQHDFKKLPDFIPTNQIPADTDANPSKGQAQRKGVYHECPLFQITTYDGKDTQMGREKRFGDVLRVSKQNLVKRPSNQDQEQKVDEAAVSAQNQNADETAVSSATANGNGRLAIDKNWEEEAASCHDELMFTTSVLRARPFYQELHHVESFLDVLFGGFDAAQAPAIAAGMFEYADQRNKGLKHQAAKARALARYREVCERVC